MKIILRLAIFLILLPSQLQSRNDGETEITTEDGIEVFQNQKYYLLKKNVEIQSDSFTLYGDIVKINYDKDLYDITEIFAEGNVSLISKEYGINAKGKKIDIQISTEQIKVEGKNSKLILEDVDMYSDGIIIVKNIEGSFIVIGKNSRMVADDIDIQGENIDGTFTNDAGKRIVENINVKDKQISNIKTDDTNMFAKRAVYNKGTSIIDLYENVKIIRGAEVITGDYG